MILSSGDYMKKEIVNVIEILDSGQLLLKLESGGNPSYQYVYREAAGVYWDNDFKGFKSSEAPREWTYADWYKHIVEVAKLGVGVELKCVQNLQWVNVTQDTKDQILNVI